MILIRSYRQTNHGIFTGYQRLALGGSIVAGPSLLQRILRKLIGAL